MRYCYFTNKGKLRNNNEDGLLLNDKIICETDMTQVICDNSQEKELIFCVADGIGGHEKGEVATRIVLETLSELKPIDKDSLISAINTSRDRLESYIKENQSAFGLGCVLAGIILIDKSALIFNIGDCRVYKIFEDKLIKLSRDHSIVENLVLEGLITREQAKNNPQRNIITSAIIGDGYKTDVNIYTKEIDVYEGDKFLICSDGLWEEYEGSFQDPQMVIDMLFREKTLPDNLSFILCEVQDA